MKIFTKHSKNNYVELNSDEKTTLHGNCPYLTPYITLKNRAMRSGTRFPAWHFYLLRFGL